MESINKAKISSLKISKIDKLQVKIDQKQINLQVERKERNERSSTNNTGFEK